MSDVNEWWQRYRRDGDARSLEQVVGHTRPLVASICRRVLLREQDVDDAVQQTFLRLLRHAATIEGPPEAWLATTARNACIDVARRDAREKRRRDRLAREPSADRPAAFRREAVRAKLPAATATLGDADRELLRQRFGEGLPLRVIAGRLGVTVPTASRRVAGVLERLVKVLREMGVFDADAVSVASLFGDPAAVERAAGCDAVGQGLRIATDWRSALGRAATSGGALLPGWSRPVRVGVFVSYASIVRPDGHSGILAPAEWQVSLTKWMGRGPVELVGLIEPGTSAHGPMEAALREHELTAGLIDGDDLYGLRTLDVIYLGLNFHAGPAVIRAVRLAVEEGVGLHNEAWTGTDTIPPDNDDLRAIYLSATPVEAYHTNPHNIRVPAIFERPHPAVPSAGDHSAFASSCTPVFRPRDDATVVFSKRMVGLGGQPPHPAIREGGRVPTVLVCGTLGRGRVVVNGFLHNDRLAGGLSMPMDRAVVDMLTWLAEPRRDGGGSAG